MYSSHTGTRKHENFSDSTTAFNIMTVASMQKITVLTWQWIINVNCSPCFQGQACTCTQCCADTTNINQTHINTNRMHFIRKRKQFMYLICPILKLLNFCHFLLTLPLYLQLKWQSWQSFKFLKWKISFPQKTIQNHV